MMQIFASLFVRLVSASLVVSVSRVLAEQIQCGDQMYLDVEENVCTALPSNFTILFNATKYVVSIAIPEDSVVSVGTTLFKSTLYIKEGTFKDNDLIYLLLNSASYKFSSTGGATSNLFVFGDNHNPDIFQAPNYTIEAAVDLEIGYYEESFMQLVGGPPDVPSLVKFSVNITEYQEPYSCTGDECSNGGTCIPDGDSFSCNCTEGYFGDTCQNASNPCEPNPCHYGNCSSISLTEYSCECIEGYTGQDCSLNIDDCINIDCGNGICEDLINDYLCNCNPGFTDSNCETNINECESNPCVNGTCQDQVNDYFCDCYPDWTGKNCSTDIDSCFGGDVSNPDFPCDKEGFDSCIDGNGTYTCDCRAGFSGSKCEDNIDDCADDPCQNNGTCKDNINAYSCDCLYGYTGINCETVVDFCEEFSITCSDNGKCSNIEGVGYECICNGGYTGSNCSQEINECIPDPCSNGATCIDLLNDFVCECQPDFTGKICDSVIDHCESDPCQNGATCIHLTGVGYQCICSPDFTGETCEEHLLFCDEFGCMNGGTCVEEDGGSGTSCLCPVGFSGYRCEDDNEVCDSEKCLNGGTCIEGYGDEYSCSCASGFEGSDCSIDKTYCHNVTCLNGGTCVDGVGDIVDCACLPGYGGSFCENDEDVCNTPPQKCLNGGTCLEGIGLDYSCSCLSGFSDFDCSEDLNYCNDTYCVNGGSCVDGYGDNISCVCPIDFTGDHCETELLFCDDNLCDNEGTCIELDGGSGIMCICPDGFSGSLCEDDVLVCNDTTCLNGGTCTEGHGLSYTCECKIGYEGNNCQLFDPCSIVTCFNGGTCMEESNKTSCICPVAYTGENCEVDICSVDYCYNDGNCSIVNDEPICSCISKCGGDRCDLDGSSDCSGDPCFNGGTCNDEACFDYTCSCLDTFTGDNCETPVCQEDSCLNGGSCTVVSNEIICICPAGFNGTKCEIDLEHCTSDYCQNGGICHEGVGVLISCECSDCFSGDTCEIDESYCGSVDCLNGGTCVDGIGCDYFCNCTETFNGTTCEQAICPDEWCYNGGSCLVEGNKTVCSCISECGGDRCELDGSSDCSGDPCLNGGTCNDEACFDYTCSCLDTFTGDNCETPVCQEDSCLNGGSCTVVSNEIICICPAGFNGTKCEIDLEHCTSDYCLNGGTCVEGEGLYISCSCSSCFIGDRCETDVNFCPSLKDYCMNGGTCVDGVGCEYSCTCPEPYTGTQCETLYCPEDYCENGGTCNVTETDVVCLCMSGCFGDTCQNDSQLCNSNTCKNGGTCIDGLCDNFTCVCPTPYTGQNCEILECQSDTCLNGGTCTVEDEAFICNCLPDFTGSKCESVVDGDCKTDTDCTENFFCKINCASDDYPSHVAMLFEPVTLSGVSFVSVDEARHPDIATEFSMFAVYNQNLANRGYLVYFGTTAQSRNFGIFLDSENSKFYLYYTNTTGHLRSYIITNDAFNSSGFDSYLAVTFKGGIINVYVNGSFIGASSLANVDFAYGISENSPKLFIGARYPRHYRFVGTIQQVIFFESVLSQSFLMSLQNEFYSVSDPVGECVPYNSLDSICVQPTEAPSTLCTSSKERCGPSYSCLPLINGSYTCQLKPPSCSSDSGCTNDYFCGSEQPFNGSNYFENSLRKIPGETVFLQDMSMEFDGEDVVTLPANEAPALQSDITIFAVVEQEPNNDGYVVGKGINGNLRDFGLYLRSSRKTVWLVYGADTHGDGYKEIVFFHNVTVADGQYHSVAAVVDSMANRTQLYVDGVVVGQQSPLPSFPTFRPGRNLLYVGGRPSTKYFRFKGTIRNMFISSAPLQKDSIMQLHNDAMDGDDKVTLELPKSRYCLRYKSDGEPCVLGGDQTSDFRCKPPTVCVPEFSSYEPRNLPSTNSTYQQVGVCVDPCNCDNTENYECGSDGNTYKNSCFRECVKATLLHSGRCSQYSDLYSS